MPVRRDVIRNRERVLRAAADIRAGGRALQLNVVAREAGVGVGTVYRHFADVQELTEALVHHRFAELEARAREVHDPPSLRAFLAHALNVLVSDSDFATVATEAQPALPSTATARSALISVLSDGIDRALAELGSRAPLGAQDVLVLLCGLAYAVRRSGASGDRAELYLEAFLRGTMPAPAE